MRARALATIGLLAAAAALAAPAAADVYKWVDEQGSSHFADSPYGVPDRYRDRITVIRDEAPDENGQAEDSADGNGLSQAETGRFGASVMQTPAPDAATPQAEAAAAGMDPEQLAALMQDGELPLGDLFRRMLGELGVAALVGMAVGLLLFLALSVAIAALVLGQACKWAGVEPPGFRRAAAAVLVAGIASSLPGALVGALAAATGDLGMLLALNGLSFVASLAIQIAVYRVMLTETVGRAIVVWLMNLVIWIGVTIALLAAGLLFSFC